MALSLLSATFGDDEPPIGNCAACGETLYEGEQHPEIDDALLCLKCGEDDLADAVPRYDWVNMGKCE